MGSRNKSKENYIYAYYQQINDGSIVVGKWIHLLYEYIINALESKTLIFDQKKANDAIDWIEHHTFHTEGYLAPTEFILELWQKAFISCIFGLCDPKTGIRQAREVVLIVARKNGKSLLMSAIAKYIFEVEGGFGTKIYTLAPKLEQADIIYNNIWQMITLDPEWQEKKEIVAASKDAHNKKTVDDSEIARHRQSDLCIPATNSTVKKIAFNAKKSDGFNPSLTICDEIASWSGDQGLKQYEVMKSAMGAREMGQHPSLLLSCSTSGYVNDSIYDELFKRATSFLLGSSKERKLFPFLYVIDDIDKWNDINELRKSNPNLGVSVSVDYLLEEIAIAEGSLSKKAEFITKMCNLKQNASTAWLDFKSVDKCSGEEIKLEDYRNTYCVCGVDLSKTTDITSCCALIEKDGVIHVYSKSFMPRNRIEQATAEDNTPYPIFEKQGYLTLSGENHVNYNDCYQFFVDLVEKYQIYPLKIGYDRYSAQYLVDQLKNYGFHVDNVYQGFNLSTVVREVEGEIKDGHVDIGANNLLKAHILNVALKADSENNKVMPVKIGTRTRIDACMAMIDAFTVRQKYYAEIGEQLKNEV